MRGTSHLSAPGPGNPAHRSACCSPYMLWPLPLTFLDSPCPLLGMPSLLLLICQDLVTAVSSAELSLMPARAESGFFFSEITSQQILHLLFGGQSAVSGRSAFISASRSHNITGVNSSGHAIFYCSTIPGGGVFFCMDTDTHRYQVRSPADEKGDGEGTPPSREFLNLFNTYLLSIFHMLNIVLDAGDSAMQKTFKQKSLPVRSVYPVGGTEKLSR